MTGKGYIYFVYFEVFVTWVLSFAITLREKLKINWMLVGSMAATASRLREALQYGVLERLAYKNQALFETLYQYCSIKFTGVLTSLLWVIGALIIAISELQRQKSIEKEG